jgi:ATP-dependent Clp protease ATP-binding subunit ClpC
VIGATTITEYRKYIEKDAALERRFQPVHVEEPSEEDTVSILKGLRDSYEAHHRVKITDDALEAAAKLSQRYITDRFLPDKAIDLIDEASARARIQTLEVPEDSRRSRGASGRYAGKKKPLSVLRSLRRRRISGTRKGSLSPRSRNGVRAGQSRGTSSPPTSRRRTSPTIVSEWTGIPVTQLTEEESRRLLRMEDEIKQRLVGQDEAIHAVARAIRRSRSGMKDPKRPVGSFMFLGPTGVGKTEMAGSLAEFLFGSDDAMIRLDMSEFMERHEAASLSSSPPDT